MQTAFAALLASAGFAIGALPAGAQDPGILAAAMREVERALPAGWTILEQVPGRIPYGHHWCDDYTGPTGVEVVALGPQPVEALLEARDGGERQFLPVALESLALWFMPPDYRESWWAWLCLSRPIAPTPIVSVEGLQVFGRPGHRLNSEAEFSELMRTARSATWPGSPWNDPSRLSWGDWQAGVEAAVVQAVAAGPGGL